jgi:Uma2 family endonuclease
MTAEQFDSTPESAWDGRYRYELIRGVLVVSPPPGNAEVDPNQYLGYLLLMHKEHHPEGKIVDKTLNEQTLVVGGNRRRCDRAIWTRLGRRPNPEKDVPTIAIEFVSGSARDRVRDYDVKLVEYLAVGVREYWIIDRFQRIMTTYRSGPTGPVSQVTTEDQGYETDLLPGFVLPLARLLALADEWKPTRRKRSRKPKPPAEGSQ